MTATAAAREDHATPSTYEAYWDMVLGPKSAEAIVYGYDLVPSGLDSFREWVGEAQSMARLAGDPSEGAWAERAAKELRADAQKILEDVAGSSADAVLEDAMRDGAPADMVGRARYKVEVLRRITGQEGQWLGEVPISRQDGDEAAEWRIALVEREHDMLLQMLDSAEADLQEAEAQAAEDEEAAE